MPIPLPYRVRQWLTQRRLAAAMKGLNQTRPLEAASPKNAKAEVFMLICKRDLTVAVLALKSLLRFANNQLAVTITNDGSLSKRDQAWIEQHIPNHRWLNWPDESVVDSVALADRPFLTKLYQSDFPLVAKLVHPFSHRRMDRVIVLDPDTSFNNSPDKIIAWWNAENVEPLFMHDHQDENDPAVVPPSAERAFVDIQSHIETTLANAGPWTLSKHLFNSGLLAFDINQINLDAAEAYLNWRDSADLDNRGKMGIWFGPWTLEQFCYHIMFAHASPIAMPLGDDYWLGGGLGHVFNHFMRHYLMQSGTHDMLRKLVAQLPR